MRFLSNQIKWLLCLTLVISAIAWQDPYFLWHDNKVFRISILFSIIFFVVYLINNKYEVNKIDFLFSIGLVIILIYYSLPGSKGVTGLTFGYIAMVIFMLISDKLKQKVFIYYSWIFSILLIPGIIIMVLFLLGFDLSYNIIESPTGREYRQYLGAVNLTFLSSDITGFKRLHGVFDEPGVVGTFAALLLIADNFRIKNNPRNIIILIGGILSFSFAFMVMLLIYLILKMNIKQIIFTFTLLIAIIALIPNNSEILDKYVFERFTITEGKLAGDNRISSVSTEQELTSFYTGDFRYIFFGMGNEAQSLNSRMTGDSWQFFLYDYGIFGIIILLFAIFIYIRYKVKSNIYYSALLIFIFLLSFYQRHDIINLYYMIVLIGGLINLQQNNYNKQFSKNINKTTIS